MEDGHGLNLNLTLKCPPPPHHHQNHTVNPLPIPPPSKLLNHTVNPLPIPPPSKLLNHTVNPLPIPPPSKLLHHSVNPLPLPPSSKLLNHSVNPLPVPPSLKLPNHSVNPLPLPPPSKLLSSLGLCPYKLIPSPYNSIPHNHQILPLPNHKPLSYADMDKERTAYIEEKRRQAAAAMVVKERERPEVEVEVEEELVVSSPNSAVSTTSNKRSVEREENYEADRELSPNYIAVSEDEDGGDAAAAAAARKKLRLSKEQAAVLEEIFKAQHTLSTRQKVALAKQLDLRPRQVEVWFQNRRARTKLKQTEINCRYLKRYCHTLSEENKRLQKELIELRALRASPVSYMNMPPPTTLSMCPQCVRSSSSSSTQASSAAGAVNTNHPKTTPAISFAKLISSKALDIRHPRP